MLGLTSAQKRTAPIKVVLSANGYVWKDDNVIDVVLTPLPMNVTTIYVPGLPDDVGCTSTGCTVSGSIDGPAITGGYGGLDRMYCLRGLTGHVSKIAELEHYWFVWGSVRSDGRWEVESRLETTGEVSQPVRASLTSAAGPCISRPPTTPAAAAVSLGIAWMHGTVQGTAAISTPRTGSGGAPCSPTTS